MPIRHFLRSDIFTVAIERNSFFRLFDKICYNIFMILRTKGDFYDFYKRTLCTPCYVRFSGAWK